MEQLPDAGFVSTTWRNTIDPVGRCPTRSRHARRACVALPHGRDLAIAKSRRAATDGYRIVDPQTGAVVRDGSSGDYSLTIEQAEAFLGDPQSTKSIAVANLNAANDE